MNLLEKKIIAFAPFSLELRERTFRNVELLLFESEEASDESRPNLRKLWKLWKEGPETFRVMFWGCEYWIVEFEVSNCSQETRRRQDIRPLGISKYSITNLFYFVNVFLLLLGFNFFYPISDVCQALKKMPRGWNGYANGPHFVFSFPAFPEYQFVCIYLPFQPTLLEPIIAWSNLGTIWLWKWHAILGKWICLSANRLTETTNTLKQSQSHSFVGGRMCNWRRLVCFLHIFCVFAGINNEPRGCSREFLPQNQETERTLIFVYFLLRLSRLSSCTLLWSLFVMPG